MKLEFQLTKLHCAKQQDLSGWDGVYFVITIVKARMENGTAIGEPVAFKRSDITTIKKGKAKHLNDSHKVAFEINDGEGFAIVAHVYEKDNGQLFEEIGEKAAQLTPDKWDRDGFVKCFTEGGVPKSIEGAIARLPCVAGNVIRHVRKDDYLGYLSPKNQSSTLEGTYELLAGEDHGDITTPREYKMVARGAEYNIGLVLNKVG